MGRYDGKGDIEDLMIEINKWSRYALSLFPINFVAHDIVEVVSSHESVFIEVGFRENVVDLVISEVFSKFLGDLFKFEGCDLSLNKAIITDLLTSNEPQTLSISARLSFSPNLAVASLKNSAKSIPPDWSSSSSARI